MTQPCIRARHDLCHDVDHCTCTCHEWKR
jgi:hypothetical protein